MTAFGFTALLQVVETQLVAGLNLLPLSLPASVSQRQGVWKGAPVFLAARAYRSHTIAYARFVTVTGRELEIGNALCLSIPARPLPIFGVDLVGFAADKSVVVADLSPVVPNGPVRQAQLQALVAARQGCSELPSAGVLPAWCQPWFSPLALFARPTAREAGDVAACLHAFPAAYLELARTTGVDETTEATVSSTQRAYGAAHRDEDKGLGMLAKLFDAEFARRFIGEVMFPDQVPQG